MQDLGASPSARWSAASLAALATRMRQRPAILPTHPMGHDLHFLSRLERLDDHLVDYAMSLYRNVPLVKAIVEATAPKDAARVAIALGDGPAPPSILVTADGHFVTCLAAGMRHDLPVISRRAVDEAARGQEELRRLLALADAMKKDRSYVGRTMRVYEGPRLSREEMESLVGWAPVLGTEYVRMYFGAMEGQLASKKRLQAAEGLKPRHEKHVRHCWEGAWAAGHLAVAAAQPLRRTFAPRRPEEPPDYRMATPVLSVLTMLFPTALRGIWLSGALGPEVIDDVESTWTNDSSAEGGWTAGLSLVAIGLRWPELRERAASALDRPAAFMPQGDEEDVATQDRLRQVLSDPCAALERHLVATRMRLSARGLDLSAFDDAEALAASFYEQRGLECFSDYLELIDAVAFVAASEAAELYLPEALLARLPPEDRDESARAYADFLRGPNPGAQPPPPPPLKAGRNEPCPCGSGKKFKKCHGA